MLHQARHHQASWTTPAVADVDGSRTGAARLARLSRAARRLATGIADFYRELDRGWAVMHGQRPPDQPSPRELDTLVRTRVLRPPHQDR